MGAPSGRDLHPRGTGKTDCPPDLCRRAGERPIASSTPRADSAGIPHPEPPTTRGRRACSTRSPVRKTRSPRYRPRRRPGRSAPNISSPRTACPGKAAVGEAAAVRFVDDVDHPAWGDERSRRPRTSLPSCATSVDAADAQTGATQHAVAHHRLGSPLEALPARARSGATSARWRSRPATSRPSLRHPGRSAAGPARSASFMPPRCRVAPPESGAHVPSTTMTGNAGCRTGGGWCADGPIAGSGCVNARCSTSSTACWSRWWGSPCCSSGWRRSRIPAPVGRSSSWAWPSWPPSSLGPPHPRLHWGPLRHRHGLAPAPTGLGPGHGHAVLTAAIMVGACGFRRHRLDGRAGGPGTSAAAQSPRPRCLTGIHRPWRSHQDPDLVSAVPCRAVAEFSPPQPRKPRGGLAFRTFPESRRGSPPGQPRRMRCSADTTAGPPAHQGPSPRAVSILFMDNRPPGRPRPRRIEQLRNVLDGGLPANAEGGIEPGKRVQCDAVECGGHASELAGRADFDVMPVVHGHGPARPLGLFAQIRDDGGCPLGQSQFRCVVEGFERTPPVRSAPCGHPGHRGRTPLVDPARGVPTRCRSRSRCRQPGPRSGCRRWARRPHPRRPSGLAHRGAQPLRAPSGLRWVTSGSTRRRTRSRRIQRGQGAGGADAHAPQVRHSRRSRRSRVTVADASSVPSVRRRTAREGTPAFLLADRDDGRVGIGRWTR